MKKIFIIIFCFFITSQNAIALIEVDITRGNLDPLPIAVSPLYVEPDSQEMTFGDRTMIPLACVKKMTRIK